jgi:hypothetical protein
MYEKLLLKSTPKPWKTLRNQKCWPRSRVPLLLLLPLLAFSLSSYFSLTLVKINNIYIYIYIFVTRHSFNKQENQRPYNKSKRERGGGSLPLQMDRKERGGGGSK